MTHVTRIEDDGAATQPVPNAVFHLDDVAGKERYDLWKDSIACIFDVDSEKDVRDESFTAQVDANMFGPVMVARTQSLGQSWKRTPSIMARDGMDHYMVQLYERGQMQWEDSSGLRELPEKGLVIFDLAREMASRTNDFANISLIIPRDMLEGALKSQNDQHLRTLSGEEPMVKLLRDHMMSLKALASQMSHRQAIEIAPATVGLTAACLNAAIDQEAPSQTAGVAMAQLTMIRRFIEANLSESDLSAEWIARRVGASRSKLYQLFDVFGGVGAYIRDRRLRRALLALTDERSKHRPIYDIALASGYTSDAAFSRAFRTRYGIAPRDVRNKKWQAESMHRLTDELDRRYERWLHHLSV
ncbi:helix-turn-helix domain-containing protein [Nisaea nitritireducens]|uniref:helix-turn-helix domain-containing protein n=1 Tax=Nisaea nitritireducens TaxID=568392 RepID=UPI00186794BE|nr:helix-turn-helix domain-containing protein [Nisaea nitritireducens]